MEQLLIFFFFHFLVGPSWNQKKKVKEEEENLGMHPTISCRKTTHPSLQMQPTPTHIQSRTSLSNGVSCRRSTAAVRVAVCLDCGRGEEEETCNNNNNNMIDGRRLNPIRVKDPKEKVLSPFTHTHTERERENQKAQTIICRHYRVCTKLSLSGLPIFRLRSDGISSFFFSLVFRLSQQQQQRWWFVFSCLVPGLHTHTRKTGRPSRPHTKKS